MIQRDIEDRLRAPHADGKTQGKKNVEKDISFEREKGENLL